MFRIAVIVYVLACIALLATSLLTGRRAERITGEPHYLLTRTSVLVEQRVEADNATDAALDALFEEAGEPPTITVAQPLFVLGLLDATAPAITVGGFILALAAWRRRRKNARAAAGP